MTEEIQDMVVTMPHEQYVAALKQLRQAYWELTSANNAGQNVELTQSAERHLEEALILFTSYGPTLPAPKFVQNAELTNFEQELAMAEDRVSF